MKKTFLIVCVLISISVIGQNNTKIDSRLLVDKNVAVKAEENFKNNPEEYNLMVFELNNGWFTQSLASLNESQKSQLLSVSDIVSADGKPFDPAVLSNPATFNFYAYNFQRSATKTVAYDLGNGNVLVFYSAEKLRLMYSQNSSK
jgi:hypothetical protein